jgi:hypothetical protein
MSKYTKMSIDNALVTFEPSEFSVTGTYFTTSLGGLAYITQGITTTADLVFSLLRATESGTGQSLLSINLAYEVQNSALSSITPSLSIIEHTASGETVIPVATSASGFSTAVGSHLGVLTLSSPMFDTDGDNRLLRFRVVMASSATNSRVLVRSSEATYDHEMISRDSEFAGCTTSVRIDSLPYVVPASGKYRVDSTLALASGVAITVPVDNVCIDFCCDGKLDLSSTATAFSVSGNNVVICGNNSTIDISGAGSNAIAVAVAANVNRFTLKNLTFVGAPSVGQRGVNMAGACDQCKVAKCSFSNFESAVRYNTGTCSSCSVRKCNFSECQHSVRQVTGATCTNCRIEYNNHLSTLNNSYLSSYEGVCVNCSVNDNKSQGGRIYCFDCTDSVVIDNELAHPNCLEEAYFAIQTGSPKGAAAFSITTGVGGTGCKSCLVARNNIRCVSGDPDNIVFIAAVFDNFCNNCRIKENNVWVDGGPTLGAAGIGILTSYGVNCMLENNKIAGSMIVGADICDWKDFGDGTGQCFGCVSRGNQVHGSFFGLTLWRCQNGVVEDGHAAAGSIGIHVSNGAANAVVRNCTSSGNAEFGIYNGTNTVGKFTVPPCGCWVFETPTVPLVTVLRDCTFVHNGTGAGDNIEADTALAVSNNNDSAF